MLPITPYDRLIILQDHKLKPLNLSYQGVYGRQAWFDVDLACAAPNHKFI